MKGERLTIRDAGEIEVRLRSENEEEVKIRLIFLNMVANLEIDLEVACRIFGIATPTGYLWIGEWNKDLQEL